MTVFQARNVHLQVRTSHNWRESSCKTILLCVTRVFNPFQCNWSTRTRFTRASFSGNTSSLAHPRKGWTLVAETILGISKVPYAIDSCVAKRICC